MLTKGSHSLVIVPVLLKPNPRYVIQIFVVYGREYLGSMNAPLVREFRFFAIHTEEADNIIAFRTIMAVVFYGKVFGSDPGYKCTIVVPLPPFIDILIPSVAFGIPLQIVRDKAAVIFEGIQNFIESTIGVCRIDCAHDIR